MNSEFSGATFPTLLKALLVTCIALPVARIAIFPDASGGALFWSALFAALSLSTWVGKSNAAKALSYILYFFGAIAPVTLLVAFQDWPATTFLIVQAAVHLATARQLQKNEQLQAFFAAGTSIKDQAAQPSHKKV